DYAGRTGIDLNRAGTPLLEIVTEPDMRASVEAVEYAKALHSLVVWLGICDGNMQEGSFRCDANVSVRKPGADFGTRREIKNLNSFKFMQQAIDFEIQWQIDLVEDGGTVQQATVLFNPDSGETRAMRTKEDAHDYRYFPDPDLPPLVIAPQWIERVRGEMPELAGVMAARFQKDYGLPAYDATMMTQSKAFAAYFEKAAKACGRPKLVANWLMGEVARRLNAEDQSIENSPVSAETLAALISRIDDGTVSNSGAKQAFDGLWISPPEGSISITGLAPTVVIGPAQRVDALIDSKGLKQMSDTGELERILDAVLAANAKSVEEFRAGKDKAFNALIGQAMKATQGKANPAQVNELLKKKLG
ncbi:MAG TPA: Asp-tRNA(Asn)/Glu-tRNA(Gln) amidotransferase subunit GatB, partial [Rhizobacter sp.]|nr:Asp-tRNA(Asn)/Glu-tRNA(Gln) amidotransferase subunit GatB [Rhizobacter sp.]